MSDTKVTENLLLLLIYRRTDERRENAINKFLVGTNSIVCSKSGRMRVSHPVEY